jgi:hypothetical protein
MGLGLNVPPRPAGGARRAKSNAAEKPPLRVARTETALLEPGTTESPGEPKARASSGGGTTVRVTVRDTVPAPLEALRV